MVNAKTTRWAQALLDNLTLLLGATGTAYNVTQAYDTNTDIYVTAALAAGGNHSNVAIIKLIPTTAPASGAKDSLGLGQTVYSPHIVQVLFDINTASGTSEVVRAYAMVLAARLGARVEVYGKDPGAGNVAVTDIASANFKASLDDIIFGVIGNV
jgi:hypothetical protein